MTMHDFDDRPQYVDGNIIVQFKEGTTLEDAKAFISNLGLECVDDEIFKKIRMLLIAVPNGQEDTWCVNLCREQIVQRANREVLYSILE